MSSQFVDLNGDGIKDILVGSFSGAPQWIEGSQTGYLLPKPVTDRDGEEVLISAFWNRKTNEWDESERSGTEGHCTSSSAVDWDGDGDLDLLLGDYYGGRLYVRLNEGSATTPAFAGTNAPVIADGKPLVIEKGLAAPRVVDWDGDGKFDILCGGAKGGIYFFKNISDSKDTRFAKAVALIEEAPDVEEFWVGRTPMKDGLPTGPGSSFHIEPVDYDGDGDLDLLVGARTSWVAGPERVLTDEESAIAAELQSELGKLHAKLSELSEAAGDEDFEGTPEAEKLDELYAEIQRISAEMEKYDTDPSKEGDFIWLLRRKSME